MNKDGQPLLKDYINLGNYLKPKFYDIIRKKFDHVFEDEPQIEPIDLELSPAIKQALSGLQKAMDDIQLYWMNINQALKPKTMRYILVKDHETRGIKLDRGMVFTRKEKETNHPGKTDVYYEHEKVSSFGDGFVMRLSPYEVENNPIFQQVIERDDYPGPAGAKWNLGREKLPRDIYLHYYLGRIVWHKDIYNGKEHMKIVGLRPNLVELEGDYSGGTNNVCQSSWMPMAGVLFEENKTSAIGPLSHPETPYFPIVRGHTLYKIGMKAVVEYSTYIRVKCNGTWYVIRHTAEGAIYNCCDACKPDDNDVIYKLIRDAYFMQKMIHTEWIKVGLNVYEVDPCQEEEEVRLLK